MLGNLSHLPLTGDDKRWLQRILSTKPVKQRKELLDSYATIFEREIANNDYPEHQRDNKARTKANTWIRAKAKGVASDIVKNCTTCEMMSDDGVCFVFREKPPTDFKTTKKQECDQWLLEVPF